MKNRRNFLKATAGAGTLALSKLAVGSTDVLPAVTSLLLDDDSDFVACRDVVCSGFEVTMDYAFGDTNYDKYLEMETPGGSRVSVSPSSNDAVDGQCNSWNLMATGGRISGQRKIVLSDDRVKSGRYPIFARNGGASVEENLKISLKADVCGVLENDSNNLTLPSGGGELLIGSVNISSGGTPVVRAIDISNPSSAPACQAVECSEFSVILNFNDDSNLTLLLETPGGSKIENAGISTNISGRCNDWRLRFSAAESNTIALNTASGATINPGRYPIFVRNSVSATTRFSVDVRACGVFNTNFSRIAMDAGRTLTVGSINISNGGTPSVRIFTRVVDGAAPT